MKTICLCNSNIPWGGGEVWHFNAALSLAARGWRVFLLCHPAGELYRRSCTRAEVTVVPFAISRLSFLNPITRHKLRQFFLKVQPDAVIMNLPADLKAVAPAAHKAGVPKILYRRGSALPVRNSVYNRHLLGTVVTHVIANSKATRDQLFTHNPNIMDRQKVSIIPNGVDIAAFDAALATAIKASSCEQSAPLDIHTNRPFTLGTAGRLNRQKGQHILLYLAKRLRDAGLDFRVVIAGKGERERELKALADELCIADAVEFPGFMENLAAFWASIDLFVLPSLWEGFGNVVIEAGLARKPVFCFAVSNLPELVTDGVNGRLFPLPPEDMPDCPQADAARSCTPGSGKPGDERPARHNATCSYGGDILDAMAKAVMELAVTPAKAQAMGIEARKMAEAYSQDQCIDTLETLLQT